MEKHMKNTDYKNTNQIDILLQYLQIETNYAVIIDGKYGVGKTHFYKNELEQKIRDIPISKNSEKKYTPIHISLFGLLSIDDIQDLIFRELFPILKSKNVKLGMGITKSLLRAVAGVTRLGKIEDFIGDYTQAAEELLNFDELVICFDDLDRKSASIRIEDVFGYINSLVENQGVKILVIANEEQLRKDLNYTSSLREKVVGITIQYMPNTRLVFGQIIKDRYSSNAKLYYKFLLGSTEHIVKIIDENQSNFRNLIYFLEQFRIVFNCIEAEFQIDKDLAVLKEQKQEAILVFTLSIAFEYKLGRLNSENIDKVKSISEVIPFRFESLNDTSLPEPKKSDDEIYFEEFRSKYYSNHKFYFFNSILDFIIGIRAFDAKKLKEELETFFVIKNGVTPIHIEVFEKLSYNLCLYLTDKEYKELTLEMLSFVDKGEYPLTQYGVVFHFATRFNNILNFNLKNLVSRFQKGIRKGFSNYQFEPRLDFKMSVNRETEYFSEIREIIMYCDTINKEIESNIEIERKKNLFDLFLSNFDTFLENAKEYEYSFIDVPFWADFDFSKTVATINSLNNIQLWDLGNYFRNRYPKHYIDNLQLERSFLIKLRGKIDSPKILRKKRTIRNHCLDYLSKCLQEAEASFKSM